MPRVEVTVDADRTAHLTLEGTQQTFPDLGAAMSELARYARHTQQPVNVSVHDGDTSRDLTFTPEGRLAPSQEQPRETQTTTPPKPNVPPTQPTTPPPNNNRPDRFSGPAQQATPATTNGKTPRKQPRPTKPPRKSKRGLTIPGIVLAVLLVGVVAAYFAPHFIGSPDNSSPQSIESSSSQNPNGLHAVEEQREPVPGFGHRAAWEHKVPAGASVTASDRGVLIIDGKNLKVLNPNNGQTKYETTANGQLEFAVDTHVGSKNALVWRIGDTAYALVDGEKDARKYKLPQNARMSSAGTHVLIKSGNQLSTFGMDGLKQLPTPDPGTTPMALDGDALISARFAGPLTVTDVETGEAKKVDLEKPAEDLHVIRWVSAGHGKVVTLWGEAGSSVSSGHRIQVVVHHVDTGKIASTVTTSTDSVGEANWVRGQGHQLATFGPYMFSMKDGLLVQDGTVDNVAFNEPRGNITPATVDGAQALISDNVAYKSNAKLLAVGKDESFAIVRSNPETISGYTK
ncbi:hypothetical protein QP868_11265 [Brevibacterium sp. UMB1308A]|uniref:hypothetical protein n=1 Tax=Brevibacterium sp. UMB1308A TaxID=3050608 RepID=UPI00255033F4|nr:hypothetical protein [Brevibacterium sp. UMB1308A]MDK8347153.1 hypothetical protein [Brevibacterium sp. UMB1308B]MDK8714474.1 hypothetical protein [Brevibacterium sp. UMB1308A]